MDTEKIKQDGKLEEQNQSSSASQENKAETVGGTDGRGRKLIERPSAHCGGGRTTDSSRGTIRPNTWRRNETVVF